MKVIQITLTPLAGSPIRIVKALNAHTYIEARLINLRPNIYGNRVFEEDLIWDKDKEQAIELISSADIIHFHHWIDLEQNRLGVNFKKLAKKEAKFIRQFHTNIHTISKWANINLCDILDDPLPKLVLGQFHERFYPKARVVPNIVPINEELYLPLETNNNPLQIFYSPTENISAWDSRWDTKGEPELTKILNEFKKDISLELNFVKDKSFDECMKIKQNSDIVIDDIITGSYHLTSLEGLAQGKPVLSYLDSRTIVTLMNLTGADELPWVNVSLNETAAVIKDLYHDAGLRNEIGNFSRNWMEKYYSDKKMVQHFVKAYEDLLKDESLLKKNRFGEYTKAKVWLYETLNDYKWQTRKNCYLNSI